MRSSLSSLRAAGVMAACLVSSAALANSIGISGRSGKQQGQTCTASGCHAAPAGTTNPTVTLEGPESLAPGATGNYRLIVRGGPGVRAGFNVAVDGSNDAKLGATSGTRLLSGEVTHSAPKAFANGEAVFDFTLVAPASGSTLTLYGAGNSANFNQTEAGDASGTDTLQIKVGDGGGGGGDDEGGCAAAGGAPLLGAALLLLGARLRRRR
ncbi:MXAN_6652 family MXYO-CTERM-anchored protein [Pyxidicoccus xibeiensis]|uniref:MXAN_6652 family MXYO-CTERM-anchored protein n=1 Tax=Pyxidicoccus xibeiensis TaxID=2906759 RepID=UPI0020A7F3AA|nr:MXAN_6652 family MXYO-CTERM-anchored protein [Pyxidicoccus xibeiensis]MCP3139500.1 hypothetical protein [Pyxidicoccus xibeiensis]